MDIKEIIDKIAWYIPSRKLRDKLRNLLLLILVDNFNIRVNNLISKRIDNNIRKITPQAYIKRLEIDISEHCNLNCYSCSHFSQIAEEKYYDLNIFENDIKQLFQITNGLIGKFHIMGGEPLLNKNCKEYFYILRKYFTNSKIWLITNGILLPKQDESFFRACLDNNVEIHPTKYPININWDEIKKICSSYNVPLFFYNNEEVEKVNFKFALSDKREFDSFTSFINCFMANSCIALKNGKLYTCGIPSYIERFNNFSEKKLEVKENDYIDIYKITNYNEILRLLAKPIPFCEYCNVEKRVEDKKWKVSTKTIDDYFDNEIS